MLLEFTKPGFNGACPQVCVTGLQPTGQKFSCPRRATTSAATIGLQKTNNPLSDDAIALIHHILLLLELVVVVEHGSTTQ